MAKMGIGLLGDPTTQFKRKFRWMFTIKDVVGDNSSQPSTGLYVYPPSASARPKLSFKEAEAQHLSETIYYPVKPDWKPVTLKLYDIVLESSDISLASRNPVMDWIKNIYISKEGEWWLSSHIGESGSVFKRNASVTLYDGCGCSIETWTYENAYPMDIDFSTLEMSSSEVLTIDLTLRYDRAYISG